MTTGPVRRHDGHGTAVRVATTSAPVWAAVLSVPGDWIAGAGAPAELGELVRMVGDRGYLAAVEGGEQAVLRFAWPAGGRGPVAAAIDALLVRGSVELGHGVSGDWMTLAIGAPGPTGWEEWGVEDPVAPGEPVRPQLLEGVAPDSGGHPDAPVQVVLQAALETVGGGAADDEARALDSLYCFVLGGVPSSRLQAGLRDDEGLVYYINSTLGEGTLNVVAQSRRVDSAEVGERILAVVDGMSVVSADEIRTACDYFDTAASRNRCNPLKTAGELVSPPRSRSPYERTDDLLRVLASLRRDAGSAARAVSGRYSREDFDLLVTALETATGEGVR